MAASISDIVRLIGAVVDLYKQVKSNKSLVYFFIEKIRKIEPFMRDLKMKTGNNLPSVVSRDLREFYDLLGEIQRFITKFIDLNYMMKVWKRNKHYETFVGFNNRLEDFISRMGFGIVSKVADQLMELFKCIEKDKIELHQIIASNHDLMEANHLEVLEALQEQIKEVKLINKGILHTYASKKPSATIDEEEIKYVIQGIMEAQRNDIASMFHDLFIQMITPQPPVLHPRSDEKEIERLKLLINAANEPSSGAQQASHDHLLPPLKTVAVSDVTFSRDSSSCLGEGGFGEVYLGQHAGTSVAVKVIRGSTPIMLKALKKEAMIMQLISNNPDTVAFYGIQVVEAPYYIVMEYCVLSLYDLLYPDEWNNAGVSKIPANLAPFTEERKTTLLYQVCCAMQYMHALKIAHRNLKPANILISAEGQAKLSDIGLAQIKHTAFTMSTSGGAPKGKAYYMAPELILSASPVYNESSDTYAFGVMMNETLDGKKPFEGLNMQLVQLMNMLNKNLDFRPDLFRKDEDFKRTGDGIVFALQKLIIICWDSNPTERYSFKDLAKELRMFVIRSSSSASSSNIPPPIPPVIVADKAKADKEAADKAKVEALAVNSVKKTYF